jgi:hypothetical protein
MIYCRKMSMVEENKPKGPAKVALLKDVTIIKK